MKRLYKLIMLMLTDYFYLFKYHWGKKLTTSCHLTINAIDNDKVLPDTVYRNLISHKVQILGDHYLDFAKSGLVWDVCPRTGFQWSNRWHRFVNKERPVSTDIKIPWEMGRLQHLTTLMLYAKSDEIELHIHNTIVDFHNKNKIGFGVNWACTMDVSIRVVNLVIIYLLTNKVETKDFILSLLPHYYYFICKFDEWNDGNRNNHYLTNVMAKLVLSQFLFKCTKNNIYNIDAISFISDFERELDYQFTNDGVNVEGSVNYHRLSTEIVLLTYYFSKEFGFDKTINPTYLIKFGKMCEYILALYNDHGHSQIGDTDSGCIVNFCPVYRNNNGLIVQDFSKVNQRLFSIDINSISGVASLIKAMVDSYTSTILETQPIVAQRVDFDGEWKLPVSTPIFMIVCNDCDSGIVKLAVDNGYVIIKRLGKFNTGHSHLDALKVEIYIDGVFYSLFKGTERYAKPLKDRCFDRVGFYGYTVNNLFPCFSPLPKSMLTLDRLFIEEKRVRVETDDHFIEVCCVENGLRLRSNVNPFVYPEIFYPSYHSPRDVLYNEK